MRRIHELDKSWMQGKSQGKTSIMFAGDKRVVLLLSLSRESYKEPRTVVNSGH